MEERTDKVKKEYAAPKIEDLAELSASGDEPFPPLQVCDPGGINSPCVSGPA